MKQNLKVHGIDQNNSQEQFAKNKAWNGNKFANIGIIIGLVALIFADSASLRSEIHNLRVEMQNELQSMRTELKGDIQAIETKLDNLIFYLLDRDNTNAEKPPTKNNN